MNRAVVSGNCGRAPLCGAFYRLQTGLACCCELVDSRLCMPVTSGVNQSWFLQSKYIGNMAGNRVGGKLYARWSHQRVMLCHTLYLHDSIKVFFFTFVCCAKISHKIFNP